MTSSNVQVTGPNPHRVGACGECGAYRADGRPPYLHQPECPLAMDPRMDRWLAEFRADDLGGPPLYCHDPAHDHGPLPPWLPRGGHAHRHGTAEPGWVEHSHLGGGAPHRHDPDTSAQVPV